MFGTAGRYARAARDGGGTVGWFRSKLGQGTDSASTSVQDAYASYLASLGGLPAVERARFKEAWEIPEDYADHWYIAQYYRADLPRTLRFQHLDLLTLVPEHQLMQLDRQAQRHGIDARTPLLDQDLVEWLLAAPTPLQSPQFDVQGALLGNPTAKAPVLSRLKRSLKGAAALLPVGRTGTTVGAAEPLAALRERFPEISVEGL